MAREMKTPWYQATKRERIPEKVRECEFFLDLMGRCDTEGKIKEEFLFFFSAFLCAFRTIEYRAKGVVDKSVGKARANAFWQRLQDDSDIALIKNLTDFEIHGDGITLYENVTPAADIRRAVFYPPTLVQRCRTALQKMQNVMGEVLGPP